MRTPGRDECKRILFIHSEGGLGDLLLSSPVIEALHSRFIGSRVTCWVNPSHRPILENNPHVNGYLDADGTLGFRETLARVRREKFDITVLPWTTSRQAWIAYCARIPYRVGLARRLAYSWTFTHPVAIRAMSGDTTSHWVDCQLDYAKILGCDLSGLRPRIWLSDEERSRGRQLLSECGVSSGERLCCLHIGKGMPISLDRWPIEKFVVAGKLIAEELGFRLVLTGTQAEREVVSEVERQVGGPPRRTVNLAGKTDVRLLAAVIAEMDVLVCPDSGPAHIAAALDVPAVSIFALRNDFPNRWRPFEDAHRIVRGDISRCKKSSCVKEECERFTCMAAFDEHEVARAVADLTSVRQAREPSERMNGR